MSDIFLSRKYINIVSGRLERFTNKGNDTWNFRCPFCGDSKKNKHKARGYLFREKNDFYYKCWNCNLSMSFNKFLMNLDPHTQKLYKYERFLEAGKANTTFEATEQRDKTMEKMEKLARVNSDHLQGLNLSEVCIHISDLDKNHIARKYVISRKIPEHAWKYLRYTDDFKTFAMKFDPVRTQKLHDNEARLCILFFDKNGNYIGASGRSFDSNEKGVKYITLKIDEDAPKIFGLDKLSNITGDVFVFEGPIDSMFFENALATTDVDLTRASQFVDRERLVLVYDNQPRNKDVVRQMRRAIDQGYRICIWPNNEQNKDVNDMIINGQTDSDIYNTIRMNTYSDMKAKLQLASWLKS